ncbi:PRC-barrel domain-containing protein [Chloroflexota bacterium]
MTDFPLNAKVESADGPCGESTTLIIDPTTQKVTHLVVKEPRGEERLVPVDQIAETSHDLIRLDCTRAALADMKPFVVTRYVQVQTPEYASAGPQGASLGYQAPYAVHRDETLTVHEEQIPPGELAIHRGTHVDATDGRVGQVGEFLIDPASGQITHLILMAGHLWGKKEITVPVSAIDHAEKDTVYLTLDKQAFDQLPTVPVKRHYR